MALQRYREQHDAVTLENPQNIVVQKLADLNGAVTKAKMERTVGRNLGGNLDDSWRASRPEPPVAGIPPRSAVRPSRRPPHGRWRVSFAEGNP